MARAITSGRWTRPPGFFNENYNGKMVNLMGINSLQLNWFDGHKTAAQENEDGMKMHAGMSETSSMLYIVPHLVDTGYKQAVPYAGQDMDALVNIAKNADWKGYFGSEKIATAAYGEEAWKMNARESLKYVVDILENKINIDTVQRFGDFMMQSEPDIKLDSLSLKEERRRKEAQTKWLLKKGLK